MSTVSETLEQIEHLVHPQPEQSDVDCTLCSGCGKMPSYDHKQRSKPQFDGDGFVYRTPAKTCDSCLGSGKQRAAYVPTMPHAGVLGPVLQLAIRMRSESRFDEMNEALDWGASYITRWVVRSLGDRMADNMLDDVDTPGESGALTPEDLAALGIDDARKPEAP